MSQLRLNPLTGRWVAVAAERSLRPGDFAPRRLQVESDPARPCPFCPGHEEATPPALETYGANGQWQVRVVPNLYPAFDGQEPMAVTHLGPMLHPGDGQRHPRGAGAGARARHRLGDARRQARPGW